MSARSINMVDRISYILFRLAEGIISVIPMKICYWIGSSTGTLLFYLLKKYRSLAIRNLRFAYGDSQSENELAKIAKLHFSTLGANFLCSVKITTLSSERVEDYVEFEGTEYLQKSEIEKTPLIYLTPHMGAWELLAQIKSVATSIKQGAIYRALSNKLIDKHVLKRREQNGLKAFDRKDGFQAPIKHLNEGGGLGILVDQNAGYKGIWCPLFGKLASTSNLAPLMAKKTGATMYPYFVSTLKPAKWKITVRKPLLVDKGEKISKTTARMNLEVEKMIRSSPEDWFWLHNRWKVPKTNFLTYYHKRSYYIPNDFDRETLKKFRILLLAPDTEEKCQLSMGAIKKIAEGRPDTEITILCDGELSSLWNSQENHFKIIEKCHLGWNKDLSEKITDSFFDAAVLFKKSKNDAKKIKQCGIPHVAGCSSNKCNKFLDHVIKNDYIEGSSDHYLKIAESIGAEKTL